MDNYSAKISAGLVIIVVFVSAQLGFQLQLAEAQLQEQVKTITNGKSFVQGEPIAVLTTVTTTGSDKVTLSNFKSEYATVEGPCGTPYVNFAFLRGHILTSQHMKIC